ncbi:MAG: DUF5063 domain-containing protein [Pseudoflavonifractor sp.]|nr:DUF5063 domain-containing protein [Alloprevotella sp.]MCM1116884.1 DUF5063 domain-containing protein [Pseudoflavonifractor sp.]
MRPDEIAFIALCNDYCSALEQVVSGIDSALSSRPAFIASMLGLLPRLYISASDCFSDSADFDDDYFDDMAMDGEWAINDFLDEERYESVRRAIEAIMGQDDVYLEVFEEDMKYSDTPISASISEGLADIFQSLYNFVETVRDAPDSTVAAALVGAKEEFCHLWSRTACNLMRALNHLRYFAPSVND